LKNVRPISRISKQAVAFEKAPQNFFAWGDVENARVKLSKVFCGAFLQKSDRLLFN
jgi:hypothetical protein